MASKCNAAKEPHAQHPDDEALVSLMGPQERFEHLMRHRDTAWKSASAGLNRCDNMLKKLKLSKEYRGQFHLFSMKLNEFAALQNQIDDTLDTHVSLKRPEAMPKAKQLEAPKRRRNS